MTKKKTPVIDGDKLIVSTEHLARIREAEHRVAERETQLADAKATMKEAKEDLTQAAKELRTEIRNDQPRLPFGEAK